MERHRIIREAWKKLPSKFLANKSVLQFAYDVSVSDTWFSNYEISQYGGSNSIDVQNIDRPDCSYDIVICNHVLEHVQDDKKAFKELLRILKPDGLLQLTVPKPNEIKVTDDWGFPDEKKHGHYRHYGLDLINIFSSAEPESKMIYIKSEDSVTATAGYVFFWTKSNETIQFLERCLSPYYAVLRQ